MNAVKRHITKPTSIAPLAVFRILFGCIMLVSTLRFVLKGWVHQLYIKPDFFFSYYGFGWIQPLGEIGMYGIFAVMGLSALCIMLGWKYRWAVVLFFLSFTYVELLDKTHYLNHYYFVSLIAFLLLWVPANRRFSMDVYFQPSLRRDRVPVWMVHIFKFQLGVVYFFAGVAKLNPDWLFRAQPMHIWLSAHSHWSVIGPLLDELETAYLFSWAGAIFDLTVAFFLAYRPTRLAAYGAVVAFHLFTYALFQIGMFPFIMILCTLIFFSPEFHEKVLQKASQYGRWIGQFIQSRTTALRPDRSDERPPAQLYAMNRMGSRLVGGLLIVYVLLQILLPLRYMLYPGNVMWTEQGYRFSWRVMLMEKAGHAVFEVRDPSSGSSWQANNWRYLTPRQEKMMAMKPDMMVQYARYLEKEYQEYGYEDLEISVRSHVTLNGRKGRPLVKPTADLTQVERGWHHKEWIKPLDGYNQSWFSTTE